MGVPPVIHDASAGLPPASDTPAIEPEFERRASRAEQKARSNPAAWAPLQFAAGLYRAQGSVATEILERHRERPLTGQLERDRERVADLLPRVLRYAAHRGPWLLAAEAFARLADDTPATAARRLTAFWVGHTTAANDYLTRATLRPYIEALRSTSVSPDRARPRGSCPFCGGAPWVSSRRRGLEADGAQRHLSCSLCGLDWEFPAVLCPSCFEENPLRLQVFLSGRYPLVRIEVCETCCRYVKSLELSVDQRPIPEVDDLTSLPIDLWTASKGYTRIEPGLAGI